MSITSEGVGEGQGWPNIVWMEGAGARPIVLSVIIRLACIGRTSDINFKENWGRA
jgi:hypothetical protein